MTNPETIIQRNIQLALGAESDFLLLPKNTVGMAKMPVGDGQLAQYPVGLGDGSPDLVGILSPWGRWVCLEVKTPKGRAEETQKKCHAVWRRFGALIYQVRSVDDAEKALRDARERTRHEFSQFR